jgi:hypothetical protein
MISLLSPTFAPRNGERISAIAEPDPVVSPQAGIDLTEPLPAARAARRYSSRDAPIRLRAFVPARYHCTVRAKSKAGLGRAANVSIPRA